jgi:hypothetical protein
MELFAEAYGLTTTDGLVDQVIAVQQSGVETIRSLADQGYERQVAMVEAGELVELEARVAWTEDHRHLFT